MFWVFPTQKSLQSTPAHLKMVVSSIKIIRVSANWNKYSENQLLNILPAFGGGDIVAQSWYSNQLIPLEGSLYWER